MADGGAIVAGAAGAAQIIPGLVGRGKSGYNAQDISHSGMYDPNANQFGAYGADNYAYGKQQQAHAIDQRSAFQANYGAAEQDRQRALMARSNQNTMLNQMMARAQGRVPSIAEMQGQQQMARVASQAASVGASARGAGALALANQNVGNQTSNAQANVAANTQVNAANERLAAEQAAFGGASAMRGQDYGAQAQDANQAQFQAGMQQNNRNANDARAMGYEQMGHQALGAEQQGAVQMQGIAAQSHANAQAQNAATERQNAENKGLVDTIGDFFSDERAKLRYSPSFGSDFTTKQPFALVAGGRAAPSTGPADASFDVLNGGGMDVMGSLQKHSDFATQFQRDPTDGMAQGSILSDDRSKLRAAFEAGAKSGVRSMAPVTVEGKPVNYTNGQTGPDKTDDAQLAYAMSGPGRASEVEENLSRSAREDEQAQRRAKAEREMAQMRDPQYLRAHGYTRAAEEIEASRPAPAPAPAKEPGFFEGLRASLGSDFTTKAPLSTWGGVQATPDDQDDAQRLIDQQDKQREQLNAAIQQADAYKPNSGDARKAQLDDYKNRLSTYRKYRNAGLTLSDEERRDARQVRGFLADADGDEFADPPAPVPAKKEADEGEKLPMWLRAFGAVGRGLSDAQFGSRDVRSDRRAKNVIDADEGTDRSTMRDGSSDPRTNSFDKTFKRDTPADQAKVKRAFEDRAGKAADDMIAGYKASLDKGSSVNERVSASLKPSASPVAEANRTMRGEPYVYKPEFTPPDQKPGEPNFGFMAQNLEKSPITATAVKEDPNGLKRVDALKLLRVLGASVADLQEQQDQTRLALSKGGRRGRAA